MVLWNWVDPIYALIFLATVIIVKVRTSVRYVGPTVNLRYTS